MRSPNDLCLLCQENEALAKNSHIFPKFLSKKFLGKKRKAFMVSSTTTTFKIKQDSPKQDHILCDDCEKYFSILETNSTDTFKNWKMRVARNEYKIYQLIEEFAIVDCATAYKKIMRLLVYSIYWRTSIADESTFLYGGMEPEVLEEIRQILLFYKKMTKTEVFELIDRHPNFKSFPYFIVTANNFTDETKNMLAVPNAYRLLVDQFSFQLFEDISQVPPEMFMNACNRTVDDCSMIVFSELEWERNVLKPMRDQIIEARIDLLKKLGETPITPKL